MDSKSLTGIEIKDETKGEVEAVFATLNVKDKDGDVTLPGAFQNGAEAIISAYNHKTWEGALPVGKGTIQEVGDQAVFKGQFFMDTQLGRDTFAVVKHLGNRQEWSYGFKVEDSENGEFEGKSARLLKKMHVFEVSPVMRGAGVNTHTMYAKADTSAAGRRREAANGEAEADGSYPINSAHDVRAAVDDYNRSNGTPKDRAHIIARARAIGAEGMLPADWRKSLTDEISDAMDVVEDAVKSAVRVVALRAEKGKSLSKVNAEALKVLRAECETLIESMDQLLVQETKEDDNSDELNKLWLASIKATLEGE